jgi:starch phosphorylase
LAAVSALDRWPGAGPCVIRFSVGGRCDVAAKPADRTDCDAALLYDKLEPVILSLFYQQRERFVDVMRHAIALNGSFFNTQRMVLQYVLKAYFE